MVTPKFSSSAQSFHAELKRRINQYFDEKGKSTTGNMTLYTKAIILLVAFVFTYVHLVFFTPVTWVAILECLLLGGIVSAIGFNIMHDGAHGSFSKYKWLNQVAAFSECFGWK